MTQFQIPTFNQLRRRLFSEYPLSLLSGYLWMAANIVAQLILFPIYLRSLGTAGFGVLVLILAMINYAGAGIGWLSGGLQRILGETFSTKNYAGFVQAFDVGYAAIQSRAICIACGSFAL